MGTPKRERKKANRQQRAAEERKAKETADRRRRLILFSVIGALVLGGLFVYSITGDSDDDTGVTDASATTIADTDTDAADTTGAADSTDDADTAEGAADTTGGGDSTDDTATDDSAGSDEACPPEDGAAEQTLTFDGPPPDCLEPGASYSAELVTSLGTITIDLDAEAAPITVNNFVFLARNQFYDGVTFHRVIPEFVIQGGDPVGDPPGTGGPGYTIADELPTEPYQIGSLAMANSSRPDSGGSQFFIITGENGAALPGDYSLFGAVTSGLDVAQEIQNVETDDADNPVDPVIIESITITQS